MTAPPCRNTSFIPTFRPRDWSRPCVWRMPKFRRRSWLGSLAARARWQDFLAIHKYASDDATLRCHGFTARIELGRVAGLAAQVTQAWLTPRSLPECDRAFT